jgi:hypothetical protein
VGGWRRSARSRRFRVAEKIIVYRTVAGFARQAPMGLAAGSTGTCVSVMRNRRPARGGRGAPGARRRGGRRDRLRHRPAANRCAGVAATMRAS